MNSKSKLSEYKRAVLTTITMRLTRKEALDYLREHGYPISNSTLGRIKSELKRKEDIKRYCKEILAEIERK